MGWSLKDFDKLDPKLFKAFMAASEAGSFTIGADIACMTQGGISQHILKLEEQIGLPLFKRIGRQVTLTDTGHQFVKYVKRYLEMMNDFRDTVIEDDENLSGLVSYAMPASCLLSPHFPLLLQKRLDYDNIELDVLLEPSDKVVETVLADRADFGFVTRQYSNPDLEFIPFCAEEYILVGSKRFLKKITSIDKIRETSFIQYPGFEDCSELWLQSAFSGLRKFPHQSLKFTGHGSTIETALLMVKGQLGISIFPRHCVDQLLKDGDVFEFQLEEPVLNDISIAKVKNHHHPKRVLKVIDWFLEMRPA